MMRPISTEALRRPVAELAAGVAPVLQWIDIDDLVVDDTYQRPIAGQGRGNIIKIATKFRWSCFAPVVVCKTNGGKYSIVDGQHRTTAAKLIGLRSVPCQIIETDAAGQALAFKEINGATTKMSPLAIYAAAVAAGDKDAMVLQAVCACCDVTILRYPVSVENQEKPGLTLAIATLEKALKRYGRETLITALQCITQTENNTIGILVRDVIIGVCGVLDQHKAWRDDSSRLFEAFDEIDIQEQLDHCREQSKPKGVTASNALIDRLERLLAPLMVRPIGKKRSGTR